MFLIKNRLNIKSKFICLLLLVINICGCQLLQEFSSNEIDARVSKKIEAQEDVLKSNLFSMNYAQLGYFNENNRFATKFDELKLITDSEKYNNFNTELADYAFKIIPQTINTKSVMHIAQPKKSSFEDNPNLQSFIAVLYLIGNPDDGRVMNLICKTTQSLSEPPTMAKPPKIFEDLKCPLGFEHSASDSIPWHR